MKKFLLTVLFCLMIFLPVSAAEGYDLLYPFEGGYARAEKELKWGLLDETLNIAVDFTWDYIGELHENRRVVKKGEQYGFSDVSNKVVITPAYSQVYNFSEGLCAVKNADGKWGYIDTEGREVIPCIYDVANDFSCGLALVKTDGFFGYIDKNNQFVIPATYEEAYPFSENRACVRQGELYGYIDTTGAMIIPAEYELAFDFAEDGAVVKQGDYGVINSLGNATILTVWDQISPNLSGGYVKAKQNGNWVLADSFGDVLSDEYLYIGDFSEGLCPVQTKTGYGYIDADCNLAISAEWDSAGEFSEGLAPVSKEGLFGYIDTTGNLVTGLLYTDGGKVSAGWAAVRNSETGKYSFINPEAEEVPIQPNPDVEEIPEAGGETAPDEGTVAVPDEKKESEFKTVVAGQVLLLKIGYPFMQHNREVSPLDVGPILQDGRTLLPIRKIIEAIGGEVEWDGDTKKISIFYESHSVIMHLNESGAFVDGRFVILDVPPTLKDDRTLVPLRFVAEAFGCEVEWLGEHQEVIIMY